MIEEFKKFAMRGNVVDLAVGIVIGAAFTAIVNSLVNDMINPLIGAVTGGLDFSSYFLPLSSNGPPIWPRRDGRARFSPGATSSPW